MPTKYTKTIASTSKQTKGFWTKIINLERATFGFELETLRNDMVEPRKELKTK